MAVSPTAFEQGPIQQVEPLAALPDIYPSSDHAVFDPIALGGLGTSPKELWLYELLLRDGHSQLPTKDRFFPPLDRGRADVEEMIGQMEEDIETVVEQVGGPVTAFMHSLGEHLGMAVAQRRPELFHSIIGAGGIGIGLESLTPVARGVKMLLRNAKGKEDIMRDSPYMQGHIERVSTSWSPDLPVHRLATPLDELATFSDTLGIELPPGQTVEKRVIVPPVPGISWALRKTMGLPDDAELIKSPIPALHAFFPLHPEVIKYERQVRGADVAHPAQFMVAAQSSRPKLELVIA
jgi:pimeloyl-ACP methyl ester carboxylesterase